MVQFISLVFVIGASEGVDMPVRDRLLAVLVAARWGANFLSDSR
jgi:hypothetical protein